MAWLALAFTVVGAVAEGSAQNQAMQSKAMQMRQRATSARGSAQRAALEEIRQADLVRSRALAVASASGASASDKGMIDIYGDIGAEGEYRALSQLWEGDEVALGLQYGADIAEREGRAAMTSGLLKAGATAFGGASSMREEYSSKTPQGSGGSLKGSYG
jgi:hypothetical protein